MHRHYLTFAHEAALLDRLLVGTTFAACHVLDRDRVGIVAVDAAQEDIAIEISLDVRIGYALPSRSVRPPKKNRHDLFDDLVGRRFRGAAVDPHERAIRLTLDGDTELVAVFYGRGSGNLLRLEQGALVDSYRGVAEEYATLLDPSENDDPVGPEILARLVGDERPLVKALSSALRVLGPELAEEGVRHLGFDPTGRFADLSGDEQQRLLEEVDQLYDRAAKSPEYCLYRNEEKVRFGLIPLSVCEEDPDWSVERCESIDRGIARFRGLYHQLDRFVRLRGRVTKELGRRISRLGRGLEKGRDPEEHLRRSEELTAIGSLILANLSVVEKGEKRVELTDWEGNQINVSLDPKKNAVENAEVYFRKGKGARQEIERTRERFAKTKREHDRLAAVASAIDQLVVPNDYDELRRLSDGIVQVEGAKGKETAERGPSERFRRFVVAGDIEVFVGKNAKNNDELTLRFARPGDIWMHARGLPGSHVVLRWENRSSPPPPQALAQAAAIAAWYSGGRGSGLVPVIWTRKKHVRKRKGSPAGAVFVDREEVIDIEPGLPSSRESGSD